MDSPQAPRPADPLAQALVPTDPQPKFRRIVREVLDAIDRRDLRRGDSLPSVSTLCRRWSLARETVLRAYGELKRLGVVEAVPRRGYYVASETHSHTTRVFLLFDVFTPYKQTLYHAFVEDLAGEAIVDPYFHHYNPDVFNRLIADSLGRYGCYVVMPFDHPRVRPILARLDPARTLILDRTERTPPGYATLAQDFGGAVSACLTEALPRLRRYERVALVFPQPSQNPRALVPSFERFCRDHALAHAVLPCLDPATVAPGQAYLVIDDTDLVRIVERCRDLGLVLGRDVGVLSYNDTPMKRVVAEGISVISTDFAALGRAAAAFVRAPRFQQVVHPTALIRRASL